MALQSALYAAASSCSPAAAENSSEQLLPAGTRVGDDGRYIIETIIAVGGMATVYKAVDTRLGRAVCALKALFRPRSDRASETAAEDSETFRDEAMILAGLHHPGIVAVRDYFEERTQLGDFAFIVQEFVDGQNLYDRHRRLPRFGEDPENLAIAPVPEDQVALYGLALARALEYLHSRQPAVLYRDLKPHNIMRRAADGQVVLLDFGISRRAGGRARRWYSDDLGTPGYAAPEQYERYAALDARTDIYSLGVVLIELATGYNPRAGNAPSVMPRLETLPLQCSPALSRVLQRCVEADPAHRYAAAGDLICALEEWRAIPRRLRHLRQPSLAWTLGLEQSSSTRNMSRTGRRRLDMATTGASGEAFALTLSSGQINLIEASSGRTLAARKPGSQFRRRRVLPQPGSGSLCIISEAVPESGDTPASKVSVCDSGFKAIWRVSVQQGKLLAAWLERLSPGAARLAVSSQGTQGGGAAIACVEQDARSGEWRYAWRATLPHDPLLLAACGPGGGVAVLDSAGAMASFDSSGAERWRAPLECLRSGSRAAQLFTAPQCADAAIVCAGTSVESVDLGSGATRWRASWVGSAFGPPAALLDGTKILLPTRECGLVEINAASGRAAPDASTFPRPLAGLARVLPEADVFAVAEVGAGARLLIYDAASRKIIWETVLPDPGGAATTPCVSEEAEVIAVRQVGGAVIAWQWSAAL